jgi:hypothetical protein
MRQTKKDEKYFDVVLELKLQQKKQIILKFKEL